MPSDPEITNATPFQTVSGISELLLRLSKHGFSHKDIPMFLEPDPYGDLRFGKPLHSDDVISAHARTLHLLIRKTVDYLRTLDDSSLLIAVADGIRRCSVLA